MVFIVDSTVFVISTHTEGENASFLLLQPFYNMCLHISHDAFCGKQQPGTPVLAFTLYDVITISP